MAVDGHGVAGLIHVALFPGVQAAPVAVVPVEIPLQVVVGLVRGLHHGVIDFGAFDFEPAHHIAVQRVDLRIAGNHGRLRGLGGGLRGGFGSGLRSGFGSGRRGGLGGDLAQLIKLVGFLPSLDKVVGNLKSTETENQEQHSDQNVVDWFLHCR